MDKLTTHIDEAYPIISTHVFIQEVERDHMMTDGVLFSDVSGGLRPYGRVCTLICPPGVGEEVKKTMMERLDADIREAYPDPGDTFVIHREDNLTDVMLNGRLQSENPKLKQQQSL